MKTRIDSLKDDEDGIMFLPFPTSILFRDSIYVFLDIFDYCYNEMNINKDIYLITLNHENDVVIKKLGTGEIEFLENRYFDKWINTEELGFRC